MYKYNFKLHFRHFRITRVRSTIYLSHSLSLFCYCLSLTQCHIKCEKRFGSVYIHEIYYLSGDSCRCFFCCFSFLIGSMQCKSRIYIINHINLIALQSIAVLNMQLSPIVLGSFMSLLACLPACLLQKSIKSFDSAACKVWEQSVSFTFLIFSFILFFCLLWFKAASQLTHWTTASAATSASTSTSTSTSAASSTSRPRFALYALIHFGTFG